MKSGERKKLLEQEKQYYIQKVLFASDPENPSGPVVHKPNHVFLVFGFSGSGKDTIINSFLSSNKKYPFLKFARTVTRERRPSELDMADGFFIKKTLFQMLKAKHRFFYTYKRYNGVEFGYDSLEFIFQIRRHNILMIGGAAKNRKGLIEGIHSIMDNIPITTIFINRPKEKILESIKKRDDTPEAIQNRMAWVEKEWRKKPKELMDFIIWNHHRDTAVKALGVVIRKTIKTQKARRAAK